MSIVAGCFLWAWSALPGEEPSIVAAGRLGVCHRSRAILRPLSEQKRDQQSNQGNYNWNPLTWAWLLPRSAAWILPPTLPPAFSSSTSSASSVVNVWVMPGAVQIVVLVEEGILFRCSRTRLINDGLLEGCCIQTRDRTDLNAFKKSFQIEPNLRQIQLVKLSPY